LPFCAASSGNTQIADEALAAHSANGLMGRTAQRKEKQQTMAELIIIFTMGLFVAFCAGILVVAIYSNYKNGGAPQE
jgi:hypothetical protein